MGGLMRAMLVAMRVPNDNLPPPAGGELVWQP
jgi:hypothetical protein